MFLNPFHFFFQIIQIPTIPLSSLDLFHSNIYISFLELSYNSSKLLFLPLKASPNAFLFIFDQLMSPSYNMIQLQPLKDLFLHINSTFWILCLTYRNLVWNIVFCIMISLLFFRVDCNLEFLLVQGESIPELVRCLIGRFELDF